MLGSVATSAVSVAPVTLVRTMVRGDRRPPRTEHPRPQREIAHRNLGTRVDHGIDRHAADARRGQDQLPVAAAGDDDDLIAAADRFGLARVLDGDRLLVEIEHQPLVDERVDADDPLPAEEAFGQCRRGDVGDDAGADLERVEMDGADPARPRHALQLDRAARRQGELFGERLPDHGAVGPGVDEEAERPLPVDADKDEHPRLDLLGGERIARHLERIVDHRRRNLRLDARFDDGRCRRQRGRDQERDHDD